MFFLGEPSFPRTAAWVHDVYLLSGTHAGMQGLANLTSHQLSGRGLIISPGKCKLIMNNCSITARVLGVWMSGSQGADVGSPIAVARAWGAFASFRHVFTCQNTSLETRARLLNAKVGSVLLWAASTWRPSKQAVETVCGIQAKMLATMLRVPLVHNALWIEFHRRRLRAAWHLMSEPEMQLHVNWSLRRHGWVGHASRTFTDASQAMRWREFSWWQRHQGLPVTGVRHPARFHPRRFDSDVSKF